MPTEGTDTCEGIYRKLHEGTISEEAAVDLLCQLEGAGKGAVWLFAETWQPCARVRAEASVRTLVVFLSDRNAQLVCQRVLESLDERVRVVFVEGVQRDVKASYESTLRRIREEHGPIDALWYVWALEEPSYIEDQTPIVFLLQALAGAGISTNVLLAGRYGTSLERCHLESWIGYARSIERAVPGVCLAVVHGDDGQDVGTWITRLWDETHAARLKNALYLNGVRHELSVAPAACGETPPSRSLRSQGTYLITGGLGGLGYLFAAHLARRYSANLILIGRSALDERRQRKLQALEEAGGRAVYFAADVTDAAQLREGLRQAKERFGPLQGVIHAAGIETGGTLVTRDIVSFRSVQAAKIRGTIVLGEVLKESEPPAFVCYFSSLAAILGDFGSCDYAVASRFELAYARYVQDGALAICWPLWAEGGMGFKDKAAQELYLKSSGQQALSSPQGTMLFEALLSEHESRGLKEVIAVTGSLDRALALWSAQATASQSEPSAQHAPVAVRYEGRDLRERVLSELRDIASGLLRLPSEKLQGEQNLADYGFDSLLLAKLAQCLSSAFGVEILPSIFFSYATLEKLADYFMDAHAALLGQRYRGAPVAEAAGADVSHEVIDSGPAPGHEDAIAIVGMSGRFAGARTIGELWSILAEAKETIGEIPLERFDWRRYYGSRNEAPGARGMSSKWLGAIPGAAEFDPAFFEISPKEARFMDPRQRLLLQEGFRALEDAGLTSGSLEGSRIGVFVGAEQGDYQSVTQGAGVVTANHDAILAGRLSYFLDLQGPAMTINTACSSGLVAFHEACLSLRAGECDAAIAASANVICTPNGYLGMSSAGVLSPDGTCYAFDRRANGMVPGEAAVAIVLKRLADAERDGDLIYAVVRGSGINYDGRTNGLTAPSGMAQARLIRDVCARAHVSPADIEYIVTHGTGTRLGDPVEISALQEVFKDVKAGEATCALTSVKPNIGHALAASGLVSLVSLVEALRHELIPPSLHCEELSDYIDWKSGPFFVNRERRAWPQLPGRSRIGAVSSFGISGTNAHVILESYTEREQAPAQCRDPHRAVPQLFVLSAKTPLALQARARELATFLQDEPRGWDARSLERLSFTLLHDRMHFRYRCALVAQDRDHLVSLLGEIGQGTREASLKPDDALAMSEREAIFDSLRHCGEPERHRGLEKLAELYCRGCELPWTSLFEEPLRRVRVPLYPFARESYWAAQNDAARIDAEFSVSRSSAGKIRLASLEPLKEEIRQAPPALVREEVREKETPVKTVEYRNVEAIRRHIGTLLAEALYLEQPVVDPQKSFAELGVDSVVGVEFVQTLAAAYGITLEATVVYECPNIEQLADRVCAQLLTRTPEEPTVDERPAIEDRPSEPMRVAKASRAPERTVHRAPATRIAIVGASCRFPGAANLEEFWSNLAAGVDSVSEVPRQRWSVADYYDPDPEKPGKVISKCMGALADVDQFDAAFFGISPAEAECMDPQQRLLLMESWRALEDAGYSKADLSGRKVGTYVGISGTEYGSMLLQSPYYENNPHAMTGTSNAISAARLAYLLNLRGPAVAIDTACSSSLVATDLACSALRSGEIDMAVVGGVSLYLGVTGFILMSKAGMLSPEGRCFAFDARANGIVPSEGVAVLVLKRLEDALDQHDHIHGVIIGSGVNQDGRTNGITAPSLSAQVSLIEEVYRRFEIDPTTIGHVEAHGTGTRLGDPIEVQALTKVFGAGSPGRRGCSIGSVKSNIGHASAAAGLAGVLKVVLSLRAKQLPPVANFDRANEHIDLETSPFYVNRRLTHWEVSPGAPRRAAVSSFGYSGTNAHVVIEEPGDADRADAVRDSSRAYLVLLSARTPEELKRRANQLLAHVVRRVSERSSDPLRDVHLADLAHTLQVGREPMKHRTALIVTDLADLRRKLSRYVAGEAPIEGCTEGQVGEGGDQLAQHLSSSPTLRSAVETLLRDGRLDELAELWCKGVELNWSLLRGAQYAHRVPLPTYPFVMKSFWFDKSKLPAREQPAVAQTKARTEAAKVAEESERPSRRVLLTKVAANAEQTEPVPRLPAPPPDAPPEGAPAPARELSIADITDQLRRQLASVLCIEAEELSLNEKFLDLGLDSILGVEWLREINRSFDIELEAPRLYDNPTLASLAQFVHRALRDKPAEQDLESVLDELADGDISLEHAVDLFEMRELTEPPRARQLNGA